MYFCFIVAIRNTLSPTSTRKRLIVASVNFITLIITCFFLSRYGKFFQLTFLSNTSLFKMMLPGCTEPIFFQNNNYIIRPQYNCVTNYKGVQFLSWGEGFREDIVLLLHQVCVSVFFLQQMGNFQSWAITFGHFVLFLLESDKLQNCTLLAS